MKPEVEPRQWQSQALSIWRSSMRGVVAAVTGAGKTTFALMCVREFLTRCPTGTILIVVPTVALLDQWYVALLDELRADRREIGVLASGRKQWQQRRYIVAVINSARSLSASVAEARPTFLIVDECHRAGSERNAEVLTPRYAATLGLSATPERQYDDGFDRLIRPALGDVIFEYAYDKAYKDGVIVPFKLIHVRFSLTSDEEARYSALTRRIAALKRREGEDSDQGLEAVLRQRSRISWNSPLRVPLAVKIALQHRRERMIVFHESVSQATQIHSILSERGLRATIYHTNLSQITRQESLRLFKSGYYSCMVCCRALDEGLNVPLTSVGIIASSTSSLRQRIQRLGRVLRQTSGKQHALVYTLYATDAEARRLLAESDRLTGMAQVSWLSAGVQTGG